ncbi:iron-containing redox enzyme family protein [Nocardioides sp.]|uniref:iron-containing redox enzyme family protein n=1 Tax=Nocardioides sp. TaxID=35761 RepID=UPI0027349A4B|nr:iron-containing redox enzyme family protein [Nocardioides sp.]MDP3893479.1 iron-containing redox enzyme family protein [Nocardioides sp.]
MHTPAARGSLSSHVLRSLASPQAVAPLPHELVAQATDPVDDSDFQLALWMLYELHYGGFDDVPDEQEWAPHLIAIRRVLEERLEQDLRRRTQDAVEMAERAGGTVVDQLFAMTGHDTAPAAAAYLQRRATREQVQEFLRQRSVYHLKESDPQSFAVPRIGGRAKVALAELQYDEYGAGRTEGLHSALFARALDAAGLDSTYGAYLDEASATTLAVNNTMSLFSLNRRLRGASLGHLAAFEATSSIPCRMIARGIERLGFPADVAAYFHEHVEADAVHEHLAIRDICGALVEDHPELHPDVLFGAAASLHLDTVAAQALLGRWETSDDPVHEPAGAPA